MSVCTCIQKWIWITSIFLICLLKKLSQPIQPSHVVHIPPFLPESFVFRPSYCPSQASLAVLAALLGHRQGWWRSSNFLPEGCKSWRSLPDGSGGMVLGRNDLQIYTSNPHYTKYASKTEDWEHNANFLQVRKILKSYNAIPKILQKVKHKNHQKSSLFGFQPWQSCLYKLCLELAFFVLFIQKKHKEIHVLTDHLECNESYCVLRWVVIIFKVLARFYHPFPPDKRPFL